MKLLRSLACFVLAAAALRAAAPSPESIDQLLTLTHAEKLAEAQMKQYEGMMNPMEGMTSLSDSLPPKTQALVAKMQKRLAAQMKDELSWERLRSIYVQVYTDAFSQEEVDGMIAFYKTPIGQSVVNKMPSILQQCAALLQARMAPILQRVQGDVANMIKESGEEEEAPAKPDESAKPDEGEKPAMPDPN